MMMQAVAPQRRISTTDSRLAPAFEMMLANSAIWKMIRESKVHQIDNVIASSGGEGMVTMGADLLRLFRAGAISRENAFICAANPDVLTRKLIS